MRTATPAWFARHEARLAWRDWVAMIHGGRRRRAGMMLIALVAFAGALHLVAYGLLRPHVAGLTGDKASLIALTGSIILAWCLLLSQAMESITRAFYARADLDLILSSPASTRAVFFIRIGAIAVASVATSLLLLAPLINATALLGGAHFLSAYGLLFAMACAATAGATLMVALLFRTIGAKGARLISQIVAAIVGAGFVIGVQVIAIISYGELSRFAVLRSAELGAAAPSLDSLLWWPARAAMGDFGALMAIIAIALALLLLTTLSVARYVAQQATAAAGVSRASTSNHARELRFKPRSIAQTLRHKEWSLLLRDPWLASQSLMQILYLLPPALLLWRTFGHNRDSLVMLAPVLTMAAGQLAGGLAWLAISGEDAPDLVATAPITPSALMRAKIEAVMIAAAAPILPLAAAIALASPWIAGVTVLGALCAGAAATAIQIVFKTQAKRSSFRRRQTSSRVATFAEAFSSIAIAATAGLAAAGSWAMLAPAAGALAIILGARAIGRRSR